MTNITVPKTGLEVKVKETSFLMKLDTGADKSFVSKKILEQLGIQYTLVNDFCVLASGQCFPIIGRVSLPLQIGPYEIMQEFEIIPSMINTFILGMDFIQNPEHRITLDFSNQCFWIKDWKLPLLPITSNPEPQAEPDEDLVNSAMSQVKLTETEKADLRKLLLEFPDVVTDRLGRTTWAEHKINLTSSVPVKKAPYPIKPQDLPKVEEEIDKMLRDGVIVPSHSPYAAPMLVVSKKTGDIRICADYRGLNDITEKDPYVLPKIDDLLDVMSHPKYITALDLKSGFWQIGMAPDSVDKTAFISPLGKFSYKVLPFGLCNAPATFQRLMDRVLKYGKRYGVVVYMDDIIITSKTWAEHLKGLRFVFQQLRAAGLTLKLSKCKFAQTEAVVLGHKVTQEGVKIDESKISAIKNYPTPVNIKQVKSFLGLVSWHQRFVPNLATKAEPLNKLKRKNVKFHWGQEQEAAFQQLKQDIVEARNLHSPEPDCQYILTTDASSVGLGAILTQIQPGRGEVPIAYASRLLQAAEKNYSTTEQECLAVIWAVKKFRQYLEGTKFQVQTDHRALMWLYRNKDSKSRLIRWALQLQEYTMEIKYRPGAQNQVADALSRSPEYPQLGTITTEAAEAFDAISLEEIEEKQHLDLGCLEEVAKIQLNPDADTLFEIHNNILYRKSLGYLPRKPYVPEELQNKVLELYHNHPLSGHRGREATFTKIKSKYYWPKLYNTVRNYVSNCLTCQQYKALNTKRTGLMIGTETHCPFEQVGIDICGPLPMTGSRNRFIVVITDYFSKWTEIFPVRTATAKNISRILFDYITRWGAPVKILSDNGRQFVSNIWRETCKLLKIRPKYTSLYHAQSNFTERQNRIIKEQISMHVGNQHRTWDASLKYIQLAMNSTVHTSTGYSPFYLTHGFEPRLPWEQTEPNNEITTIADYVSGPLQAYQHNLDIAADFMKENRAKQKHYYDQHYNPSNFAVGDLVWKKSHPQSNAALGFAAKLHPKWEGPFRISAKINNTCTLEDVFTGANAGKWHSQQLKKYHGGQFWEENTENDVESEPGGGAEDSSEVDEVNSLVNIPGPSSDTQLEPPIRETTLPTNKKDISHVTAASGERPENDQAIDPVLVQVTSNEEERMPDQTLESSTDSTDIQDQIQVPVNQVGIQDQIQVATNQQVQNKLLIPFNFGWTRRVSVRKKQPDPANIKFDVYYYSPDRLPWSIRSNPDVRRYLKAHPNCTLTSENFNFTTFTLYKPPFETVTYVK